MLYEVAPADAHALAAVRLKAAGVHVPRACLLRRVPAGQLGPPGQGSEGFAQGLAQAGLRGDRLSAWGLQVRLMHVDIWHRALPFSPQSLDMNPWYTQGLPAMGLDMAMMRGVLADVASCAAFGSTIAGELPAMPRTEAEDLIAEAGLLGRLLSLQQLQADDG